MGKQEMAFRDKLPETPEQPLVTVDVTALMAQIAELNQKIKTMENAEEKARQDRTQFLSQTVIEETDRYKKTRLNDGTICTDMKYDPNQKWDKDE